MKKYINEKHRMYSEACQKEVSEMSKHPLTAEEKEAQMDRNRRLSELRALGIHEAAESDVENISSSLHGNKQ